VVVKNAVYLPVLAAMALAPSTALAWGGETTSLGVFFRNGGSSTVDIVGGGRRYIDEVDIVASATTTTDEGIQPVIDGGDLSGLDWEGVEMVEEDWRPDPFGTFTRQRFYRGAAWMETKSVFVVFQADDDGLVPAVPFVINVGRDDRWQFTDDGFIRRFDARQIASGCVAIGDCSTATSFTAEGLAQYRGTLHPLFNSRVLHPDATRLLVVWTADPGNVREVELARIDEEVSPFAYGFEPEIEEISTPDNGQYYNPGDAVTFAIRFRDGDGNVIAGDGDMPTYAEYLFGLDETGLRYFDINIQTTLYYALKHRESNIILAMTGPTDALRVPQTVVPTASFFSPAQTQVMSVANDGYTGLAYLIPNFGVIFGGLSDPAVWDTPIPDEYTFTIPGDAEPGTYVVAIKARRDFAGEPLNRGAVARVQVGSATETEWEPTTGNCNTCHQGEAAVGSNLHGISDRETCFGCHAALDIEPDARLDYRAHFIHSRSERFDADPWDCSTCHFDEPEGDPIGFPGFVFPF
jgi:hypothetical protein